MVERTLPVRVSPSEEPPGTLANSLPHPITNQFWVQLPALGTVTRTQGWPTLLCHAAYFRYSACQQASTP
eukprot:1136205-Pelagomonas_calceolata.AAC.1